MLSMAPIPQDSSFTAAVAEFYESTLVPLIFAPYATDLARRVQEREPARVLEVGCGTGVVTRALASALPPACFVVATDVNAAMVSHAENVGTVRPVSWRRADVMELPFEDGSFDVVVCQFATMFFPDRAAAYREVRRVLRPRGAFLFSIWNRIQDNEFACVVTDAVAELFPTDPPLFLARTPHGHWQTAEIEADVRAAGFAHCAHSQRDHVSRADAAHSPAIAFCHGTPLRNEIEARDPGGLERATAAAADALRQRFGEGAIEGRISAVIVCATK